MKTLIRKLLPGVLATLGAFALAAFCLARAQSKSPALEAAPPSSAPPSAAPAPTHDRHHHAAAIAAPGPGAATVTYCGVCGAQLQAPVYVMVAPGYAPAQPVRSIYAREEEDYAAPIVYAPAYYEPRVTSDPFREVAVNPIPFYGQVRAY